MSRFFMFADEAGDFEFSRKPRVSRYFIVCTVSVNSCEMGNALMELRRELVWRDFPLGGYFHASEDKQRVRDEVFNLIRTYEFRIHATILEKSKAILRVQSSNARFYQYGWFYHFKHVAPQEVPPDAELLITAASIGTKKGQAVFTSAVNDVVQQIIRRERWKITFRACATDPCLQIADYCTWAIQRKWESNGRDARSYDLIKDRVKSEFDLWAVGDRHYY